MDADSLFYELQQVALDQPAEVSLETLSLCNAACTFCPYPTLERKGQKMSDDLIDKVIADMAEFENPFFFSPFKVNEPLLDKRLFDICEKVIATTHAVVRIFTNGAALTQKKIDGIAGLTRVMHLWVSLNSHEKDEYEALMGMPFDRTALRLDNLHDQAFPHQVVLSTVGHPNRPFQIYCQDRWPKFESATIPRASWLGYTQAQTDVIPALPCVRWFELSIISSGLASLCCMDGEGKFPIGDVREQTLLEIYNDPNWRERREKLLSRHNVEVCRTCTY